jgi:hypothetical protein
VVEAEVYPLDDEPIVSFVDDFTARVDQGQGQPDALVKSLAPLRTEEGPGDTGRVDLDLVDAGPESMKPENALTGTRFPRDAAGSVSVGGGVRLRLAGADAGSSGQLTHGKLFYADAIEGASTDLLLVPQPAGLELLLQLRAAVSPERYELAFDLPPGARLERGEYGFVGVVDGEDVLVSIAPPAAWDADGEYVPVSYEIDGTTLVVDVDHLGRDLLYPLLVDPKLANTDGWYEWFDWHDHPGTNYIGWRRDWNANFIFSKSGADGAGVYQIGRGESTNSHTYYQWDFTQYAFAAPGTPGIPGQVPTIAPTDAYVNKAWFDMHHVPNAQDTCITQGIRKTWTGAWENGRFYRDDDSITPGNSPWTQCFSADWDSRWHCLGTNCEHEGNTVTSAGTPANMAAFSFWMHNTQPRERQSYAYLGRANVWLGDKSPPTVTAFNNPKAGQWVRDGETVTTTIRGTDKGLGVQVLELHVWGGNPQAFVPCAGERGMGCPASWAGYYWEAPLSYTVDTSWPEGAISVAASAYDIVGKHSDPDLASTTIYVDNKAPSLDIDGALWDLRCGSSSCDTKLTGASYEVVAIPTDSASGVSRTEIWFDGVLKSSCTGACTPSWTFVGAQHSRGEHHLAVVTRDNVGHEVRQSWVVDNQCA